MPDVAERIVVSESGYDFPVEDILTGRGAVFGKSGSGKSNTATVIVEELLEEGLPLLIIDQDGEYHGLKDEYEEVLHYGADTDCDRTVGVDDGEQIADVALTENIPIVLDVSGYMEQETSHELVHNVVRRLFQRENEIQKPFLLLVEEVHEYIPEQGGLDDLGKMLIRIAKRGRKRGLGICGISQRPASVDKDFITQCDWIVWHRLTWDNDTKVVGRILGSEYADRVQELGNGEAYVMSDWSEEVRRVHFRLKHSADAGATPGLEEFHDVTGRTAPEGKSGERDQTADADEEATEGGEDAADSGPGGRRGTGTVENGERQRGSDGEQPPRPSAPEEVEVNQGNPLWEFGQMVLYLFAMMFHGVRRIGRRLRPARSSTRRSVDPITGSRHTTDAWRRVALVLLLLSIGLGAVLVYLLVL